jgi:predicted small lipoprotein YifL
MRTLVGLVAALLLLQACGLRGPLYLPTPQQEREMAERERRLKERERGVLPTVPAQPEPQLGAPPDNTPVTEEDRRRTPSPTRPQVPPVQ